MVAVTACKSKVLVNATWATPLLSCTNGPRKHSFHLVGAPILTILGSFQSGGARLEVASFQAFPLPQQK